MKKTLIALAVLAVSGAAFAQSTVSIYGQFDAGVYSLKGYTDGKSGTVYGDGATFSNVIGFRGSEDLGGGLKGNFQLETDVQTNNGGLNQNGLFRRQANVSVAGGFGDIKFGITTNPVIATNGALMPVSGNSVSTVTSSALGYADFYTRNAVTYTSPSINGLVAQIQHGFANSVNEVDGGTVTAGSLAYTSGNLSLRAAMQNRKGVATVGNASAANQTSSTAPSATSGFPAVTAANTSLDKSTSVMGARYKMGALELGAAVLNNEFNVPGAAKTSIKGSQVGVGYTMGAVLLGANYTQAEKSSLTSLQARYALSKRTNIIASAGFADNAGVVGFTPIAFNTGTGTAPITDSSLGTNGNRGLNRNISGYGVAVTHSF